MFEIRHDTLVLTLEMNKVEISLYLGAYVAYDQANCILNLYILLKLGNCELIDNHPRIVRMPMTQSRYSSEISFDVIAAMEVFADIAPNILFNDKATTWMSSNPASNIENKFIEDNKLMTVFD